MTALRSQGLSNLTQRHGVKVASAVSVEDCCLAAGEVVGHEHIMSASRMNSATVVFLSSVEKANELVETGIVVDNLFTPVLPLSMPSKKVLLSNVPPFVSDETLVRIMSRYGKLVSPIKMIPVSCKSPLLKHVVSFRRFLFMILKEDEELDLSLHLKVDDCDYIIYATTEKMKCFNCGEVGHLIRTCPSKTNENRSVADASGGRVGKSAEAGPSNAAPSGTESGKMKERADVSLSATECVTAPVTNPETVVGKIIQQMLIFRFINPLCRRTCKEVTVRLMFCSPIRVGMALKWRQNRANLKFQQRGKKLVIFKLIKQRKQMWRMSIVTMEWKAVVSPLIRALVCLRVTFLPAIMKLMTLNSFLGPLKIKEGCV